MFRSLLLNRYWSTDYTSVLALNFESCDAAWQWHAADQRGQPYGEEWEWGTLARCHQRWHMSRDRSRAVPRRGRHWCPTGSGRAQLVPSVWTMSRLSDRRYINLALSTCMWVGTTFYLHYLLNSWDPCVYFIK